MVLYLQFNNPTNAHTAEWKGIFDRTGQDPDHPTVRTANLTQYIDSHDTPTSQRHLTNTVRNTLNDLLKQTPPGRLTGVVVSGHSVGTAMINGNHDISVDVRSAFETLAAENPRYAALLRNTEKVALLGCFMGGDAERWRNTFGSAAITGVENFSPLATSDESARMYVAADCAQERRAGMTSLGPNGALTRPQDLRACQATADSVFRRVSADRSPVCSLPTDPKLAREQAQAAYNAALRVYTTHSARITTYIGNNGRGATDAQLAASYASARNLAAATTRLALARQTEIPDRNATAAYVAENRRLFAEAARYGGEATSLFDIRMARHP